MGCERHSLVHVRRVLASVPDTLSLTANDGMGRNWKLAVSKTRINGLGVGCVGAVRALEVRALRRLAA